MLDIRGPTCEQPFELSAADDTEVDLGRFPRCREDRLDTLQRNQLPHEERDEAVRRRPARREQPVLRSDEADRNLAEPCEAREELRIAFRIRDDDVCGTKGAAVDRLERACGERA